MSPIQIFISFAAICAAAVWLMFVQAEREELVDSGEIESTGFNIGALLGGGTMVSPGGPNFTDAEQARKTEFYGWYIQSPGVIAADDLGDAAEKIVKAVKG